MYIATLWKGCRLTPTKTGWQVTCPQPCHHQDAKCTKIKTTAVLGEETVLRMLKTWCALAVEEQTKAGHAALWAKVEKMVDAGTLMTDGDLEKLPKDLGKLKVKASATTSGSSAKKRKVDKG